MILLTFALIYVKIVTYSALNIFYSHKCERIESKISISHPDTKRVLIFDNLLRIFQPSLISSNANSLTLEKLFGSSDEYTFLIVCDSKDFLSHSSFQLHFAWDIPKKIVLFFTNEKSKFFKA